VETTRVSSKGQVVIPKSIRDRLHLEAGATLSVGVENDAIVLHQVRKALRLPTESEIDAVAGCLKVGGPMPSRTDEDAAIAALFRKELGR
jgi:AbrB family looped-hinge helix DNA binding protein